MGEYAIRKSDGADIKIGTCENMYYLRYEDRAEVQHVPGNVDPATEAEGLRFRLPFPDEDGIEPGEYRDYDRGYRLYRTVKDDFGREWSEDFSDPETVSDPGTMQLRHEGSGVMVNLPCFHGEKLPELGGGAKAFWNGKSWSLELVRVRAITIDGRLQLRPVVQCRHCKHAWRYEWADILPFVADKELRKRLEQYAAVGTEAACV